MVIANEPVN